MIEFSKYSSQIIIPEIGIEGQKKIAQARVLVIGAGGLGCPALQYLAGLSVGSIGICDHDTVQIGNLHRQILYGENDIGKQKTDVAANKISQLNSGIKINKYVLKFSKETFLSIDEQYDVILDCCDNFETRYAIDEYSRVKNIPFVYAAVNQFEGQIAVFNYENSASYSDVYRHENIDHSASNCAVAGIVGFTTGIVACYQVAETMKIILGLPGVLSSQVMTVDVLTGFSRKLKINSAN